MKFLLPLAVALLLAASAHGEGPPTTRPAATEPLGDLRDDSAAARIAATVRELKANLDTFTLDLNYHGPKASPPYPSLTLRTYDQREDRSSLWPAVKIDRETAGRLIDHLARGNLFLCDARLYAIKDYDLPERYYVLSVRLRDDAEPRYWVYLRWDRAMFERLDGLRASLGGHAAAMDELLARLAGDRARLAASEPPASISATRPSETAGASSATAAPARLACDTGLSRAGSPILVELNYPGGIPGWDAGFAYDPARGRLTLTNRALLRVRPFRRGPALPLIEPRPGRVSRVEAERVRDVPFRQIVDLTELFDLSRPDNYEMVWGCEGVAEQLVVLRVLPPPQGAGGQDSGDAGGTGASGGPGGSEGLDGRGHLSGHAGGTGAARGAGDSGVPGRQSASGAHGTAGAEAIADRLPPGKLAAVRATHLAGAVSDAEVMEEILGLLRRLPAGGQVFKDFNPLSVEQRTLELMVLGQRTFTLRFYGRKLQTPEGGFYADVPEAEAQLFALVRRLLEPANAGAEAPGPIDRVRALRIADRTIEGKVQLPPGTEVRVEETDALFIVTYPTRLPPRTRGADYHARVEIDKQTGEVRRSLVGS